MQLLQKSAFKEIGSSLIDDIKSIKDTKNVDVQLCRLGLNQIDIDNLLNDIKSQFVLAYLNNLSSTRRKRSAALLTCSQIMDLGASLSSLPSSNLATISTAEFTSCMGLLGSPSNFWSVDQLGVLVAAAKLKYGTIASIPDADISSLGSILYGFSVGELGQLVFTSANSLSSLGALPGWTTDQVRIF